MQCRCTNGVIALWQNAYTCTCVKGHWGVKQRSYWRRHSLCPTSLAQHAQLAMFTSLRHCFSDCGISVEWGGIWVDVLHRGIPRSQPWITPTLLRLRWQRKQNGCRETGKVLDQYRQPAQWPYYNRRTIHSARLWTLWVNLAFPSVRVSNCYDSALWFSFLISSIPPVFRCLGDGVVYPSQ